MNKRRLRKRSILALDCVFENHFQAPDRRSPLSLVRNRMEMGSIRVPERNQNGSRAIQHLLDQLVLYNEYRKSNW